MSRLDQLRQKTMGMMPPMVATVTPSMEVEPIHFQPILDGASPVARRLARRQELVEEIGDHFGAFAEIKRICGLPIVWPLTAEETEAFNRELLLAPAFESGFRLFDTQVTAMSEFYSTGGIFGPIGVGWGKTLISLMIANACWQAGLQKITLFVPPNVLDQLVNHDIGWARTRVPITFPYYVMGGRPMRERRALAKSGKKGLYIMPYSVLSTKDAEDNLLDIHPEMMICDEAHRLANRKAARTNRVFKYISEHRPYGVAVSGTITAKSVKDYHHLITWVLGENNPLPNSSALATEWGTVIDASASEGGVYVSDSMTGPLKPLVEWARRNFPGQVFSDDVTGFRLAFQARSRSAPGYVSSGDKEIGTSLTVSNVPVKDHKQQPGWEQLNSLMEKITEQWLTPNGDEIDHAIHQFKWLYELTAGFYNQLTWPTVEEYAHRKGMSDVESSMVLEQAQSYHCAGQEYARTLREWLKENQISNLDTPFLVGREMSQNGSQRVGQLLYETWREWKSLDFEGRPERDSTAIRVCDYKVRDVVEWAHTLPKDEGALVWVYNIEMGLWAYEYLRQAGFDALHCPAGDQANVAITDQANSHRIIVASTTAHGEGKNLQHFQHQYVLQWPRQARMAEQMLGRTHRNGQKADELVVYTNATTQFDRMVFAACLNDSLYIHQTTGNRQKMIYCNYDPMPVIFPSYILAARGMQVKILTSEQRAIMEDRFGSMALTAGA